MRKGSFLLPGQLPPPPELIPHLLHPNTAWEHPRSKLRALRAEGTWEGTEGRCQSLARQDIP